MLRESLLDRQATTMTQRMNEEQLAIFHQLLQTVMVPETAISHLFFLEGKAGRGKSFVVEALWMKLRAQHKVLLIAGSTALSVHSYPHGCTIQSFQDYCGYSKESLLSFALIIDSDFIYSQCSLF